jgi:hypothetical protein
MGDYSVNLEKIVGWVALIVAIVGAFGVSIPYAAAILVILGIVGGWFIVADHHVRVMVSALVLAGLASVLGNIPAIGSYLAAIFGALGTFAAGASLMVISRNIWARYQP